MTTQTDPTQTAPPAERSSTRRELRARIKNPVYLIPTSMDALTKLGQAAKGHGVSDETLELVHLRASQINGCAWCVDYGAKHAIESGESVARLLAVATWRESPLFSEAECAALALAEAMTRVCDSSDPVPDEVWDRAADHYDDEALAALTLHIAVTNLYNRINVATRQVAGRW